MPLAQAIDTLFFSAQATSAVRMSGGGAASNWSSAATAAPRSRERIIALIGPTATGVIDRRETPIPVSYTHLTLPTILRV